MNFLFWKHKKTGEVIKDTCHTKLTTAGKSHFEPTKEEPTHYYSGDDGGDFILSAIVAEATDSAAMGMLAGGDIAGSMIGESLSDSSSLNDFSSDSSSFDSSPSTDFGGGSFGGGGADGNW